MKRRTLLTTNHELLFNVILAVCLVFALDASAEIQSANEKLEALLKASASQTDPAGSLVESTDDPARPDAPSGNDFSPATFALYDQALQDYYKYRSSSLVHRSAVFQWQLFSAKLIFVIVLLLVACGIVFAAIQFRAGLVTRKNQTTETMNTELELSAKGVKVSSPVLGVIILVISLAFFYLYLVYVYPIENVF